MILKDKVAIVTGGSTGIGLAIAKKFAAEGAKVVIASLDQDKGKKAAATVQASSFIATDVRDEDSVRTMVEQVKKKFKKIDIVINNAGIATLEKELPDFPLADFQNIMETNLTSVFLITKYTISELVKSKGTIINIASRSGVVAELDVPAYSTSKAAMIMLGKSLALRYAKEGVRVNSVSPGPIRTGIGLKYFKDEAEYNEYYKEKIPLGRVGTVEEVASLVTFLASSDAGFITGANYTIDGGATLKG